MERGIKTGLLVTAQQQPNSLRISREKKIHLKKDPLAIERQFMNGWKEPSNTVAAVLLFPIKRVNEYNKAEEEKNRFENTHGCSNLLFARRKRRGGYRSSATGRLPFVSFLSSTNSLSLSSLSLYRQIGRLMVDFWVYSSHVRMETMETALEVSRPRPRRPSQSFSFNLSLFHYVMMNMDVYTQYR